MPDKTTKQPAAPMPAIVPAAPPTSATGGGVTNLTDYGNAKRLVARHGRHIRYVHAMGRWLTWDGTRWSADDTGAIMRLAKETVVSMYTQGASIEIDVERQKLIKWSLVSENWNRLNAMVSAARTEAEVSIKPESLDTDQWLLNCMNCTINLKTWEMHEHDPADLITRRVNVVYDKKAKCPTWEKFVRRVMGDDEQLIQYMQRAIGYTLTGDVSEQCLFFMIGTGKNGKSTFIETLMTLLSEYMVKTPTETLMQRNNSGVPNDVARLAGRRLIVARETDEGQRLAEATIKDLTGGDKIVARYLHQEFFEFSPTFKLWMYGNHRPIIKGTDEGIWRRIRLIPFLVTITPEERDPALPAKLIEELPGILNWALQGCWQWQKGGLGDPIAVNEATEGYRNEMDVLGAFIAEVCVVAPDQVVSANVLYDHYKTWCEEAGERPLPPRTLGVRLGDRGFTRRRTATKRLYDGIGVPLGGAPGIPF